jgi:hypothetical protein
VALLASAELNIRSPRLPFPSALGSSVQLVGRYQHHLGYCSRCYQSVSFARSIRRSPADPLPWLSVAMVVFGGNLGGLIATWSYLPRFSPNQIPGNSALRRSSSSSSAGSGCGRFARTRRRSKDATTTSSRARALRRLLCSDRSTPASASGHKVWSGSGAQGLAAVGCTRRSCRSNKNQCGSNSRTAKVDFEASREQSKRACRPLANSVDGAKREF